MIEEPRVEGRHTHQRRRPRHRRNHRVRVEAVVEDHRRARQKRDIDRHEEPVGVENGQGVDEPVGGGEPPAFDEGQRVRRKVLVRQHRAFRSAGRAGGVEDRRQVVCRRGIVANSAGAAAIFSAKFPSWAAPRLSDRQAGRVCPPALEGREAFRGGTASRPARRRRGNTPTPRAYRPCSRATAPRPPEGRRAPARCRRSTCRSAPRPGRPARRQGRQARSPPALPARSARHRSAQRRHPSRAPACRARGRRVRRRGRRGWRRLASMGSSGRCGRRSARLLIRF